MIEDKLEARLLKKDNDLKAWIDESLPAYEYNLSLFIRQKLRAQMMAERGEIGVGVGVPAKVRDKVVKREKVIAEKPEDKIEWHEPKPKGDEGKKKGIDSLIKQF
jgi:hypothetical protein